MRSSAKLDPTRRSERLFSPAALEIREMSAKRSGPEHAIEIVGRSPRLEEMLKKVAKV
ncbi:MAG: hypothetical protein IT508_12935, partial [Burkholderiaceae bacterium]|nr:hypothetical protein [Burkholderiaceae bacterium]